MQRDGGLSRACAGRDSQGLETVRNNRRLLLGEGHPAHRHGMNYRPSISALGGGRFRAEGLLFHMPGRWELVFELRADGKTERAAHPVSVE